MLVLTASNPHHESGPTRVAKDAEMVLNVIAAIDTNTFSATMTASVNISRGQHADTVVPENLTGPVQFSSVIFRVAYVMNITTRTTGVKEVGLKALSCSVSSNEKKTCIVKLNTFHIQHTMPKKKHRSVQQTRVMKTLPFFI